MRAPELVTQSSVWNHELARLPGAHILQTWEWGQIKAAYGWQPLPLIWRDLNDQVCAMALLLRRPLSTFPVFNKMSILYLPRGPVLRDWSEDEVRERVWQDLRHMAHEHNAVFLKIDPEVMLSEGVPGTEGARADPVGEAVVADLRRGGWLLSEEQVQFRNTVLLTLEGNEDDWLARMKQKTRYNIRLAQRKGVQVRQVGRDDFPLLYRMYAETSVRDGFVIRPQSYYVHVWQTLMDAQMAEFLVAEVEGQPVAALVMFIFAGKAWYFYGMSRDVHRDKMPNHLLQWEAMRLAKQRGCQVYDLWGAPDRFDEQDPMWGVFRFKQGLGGRVVSWIGAWDLPLKRQWYTLYTRTAPRILDWMRRRGQSRTRREVSA